MNIGITIAIKTPTESFFTNGIKQNAIILRDCLSKIDWVKNVYFINIGPQKDLSQSPWKEDENSIINFQDALEKVNLVICVGVFLGQEPVNAGISRGIKFVQHVMGNEYYAFTESIVFKETNGGVISRKDGYSATWISPHLYPSNKDLFEVLNSCAAYQAPYIWSPKFLLNDVNNLKNIFGFDGIYKPSGLTEKRINVFEPNIGMNKTSVTPILSIEKFYKKNQNLLQTSFIFGSNHLKNKKEMVDFIVKLDICKNKKITFEERYPIAAALLRYTDIVLSHQRDCDLNYLYFDAAWLGYPVVHNAQTIKDLGWYYPGYDAEKAADCLIKVATSFDKNGYYKKYLEKSRKFISNFLPDEQNNMNGYATLIEKVFS